MYEDFLSNLFIYLLSGVPVGKVPVPVVKEFENWAKCLYS